MDKKIIWILFISLLIFGCTSPILQEGGNAELIQEVFETDINNDGLIESTTYVFHESEYNETKIQRILIIKPKFDLSKIEAQIQGNASDKYYFQDLTISDLKIHLTNFNNKRSNEIAITGEAQCKQYLGLGRTDLPCVSLDSCAKACMGAPLCMYIYKFVGDPFSQDLYELNTGFNKMDTYISELNSIFEDIENTENNLNKQKIEEIIKKIEQISVLGNEINNNPIINKQVYYLCNRINYDNYELQSMMDKISENLKTKDSNTAQIKKTGLEIDNVEYKIYLQIKEKSDRSFSTIKITDIIPKTLNINISSLVVSSNFSKVNITTPSVEWKINKAGGGEIQSFMTYSFKSKEFVNKTWIENNIKTPYVSVETFSLGTTPITFGILAFINSVFTFFFDFSNYFIALALTGALIIILLRLFQTIVSLIWNTIIGTSKGEDFSLIKKKLFGKANPKFKQYFILGIILSLIGTIILLISNSQIKEEIIILELIGYNLTLEPLNGISAFLLSLGIISIYFSAEDFFKGSVLKTGYYESAQKIAKKVNLENLKELEKKIEEVDIKIKQALELKIDVSDEQDLIYSIPISRIKALIQKNDQRTAKNIIEQSINRCDFNIGTIDKKIQTATDIWKNWKIKFDLLLKEKGEIRKEMLIDIPRTWRSWTIEKYLTENLDENLIIEGGILKKTTMPVVKKKGIVDILNSLKNEKIKNASIIQMDGKTLASSFDKNINKSLVAVLVSRMIKAVKIIETKAKTGNTDYLVARSGKDLFFVRPINNLILFCITDSKISLTTLIELTNKTAEELDKTDS